MWGIFNIDASQRFLHTKHVPASCMHRRLVFHFNFHLSRVSVLIVARTVNSSGKGGVVSGGGGTGGQSVCKVIVKIVQFMQSLVSGSLDPRNKLPPVY